jgi:thiamine-phosphate pyrophosphorylase
MGNRAQFDLSVYVIIDPSICGDEQVSEVTRAVLDGGATFVQLRNKKDFDDVVEKQAHRIMDILADSAYSNVTFVIDDRTELAARLNVDGVHIGQDDIDYKQARKLIGEDKILGLTAFTYEHYAAVDTSQVDYLGTGPVFPTLTKPDKAVLGLDGFASLAKKAPILVVGLGGITPENAGAVIKAGADGVAMIRAVVGVEDPKKATQEFTRVVKEAREA